MPNAGSRQLVIGFLSHSLNSDNFGVGALSIANIEIVRKVGRELGLSVRFHIFDTLDKREIYVRGADITMIPLRMRSYLSVGNNGFAAVRRCDLICDLTGGDSFTDLYGKKRFFLQLLRKLAVLLARRPLLLSPQTIGPFDRWWARLLAPLVLTRCRAVVVRDDLSAAFVRKLAPTSRIVEATDVAFRLPYAPPLPRGDGPARVGINVSGLLFNGGYSRDNMFGLALDYPALVRALIARFRKLAGCEVHLISHVISATVAVEDDYRVCEALAAEFPGTIAAPRFADPIAAKSYIAGMDFFCGSRMHACIAAFSAGVPTVPIAYSRKFAGVFQSLGYPVVADCRTEPQAGVIDTVMTAFGERERLKRLVAAGNARAAERLAAYEDALRACLREIAGERR
jgi:polysaccharide pyruvyl transferase WcaK-like protein